MPTEFSELRRVAMHLEVIVSADGGSAQLQVPRGLAVTAEVYAQVLAAAGVQAGLIPGAQAEVGIPSDEDRVVVVARKRAPVAGRPARLDPMPGAPRRVAPGEDLGAWTAGQAGQDGVALDGSAIPSAAEDAGLRLGPGLQAADGRLLATRAGWYGVVAGELQIDPRGLTVAADSLDILIAEDGAAATLALLAGTRVLSAGLRGLISSAGIVHGLIGGTLREAMEVADHDRSLVLARATPVRPGVDARLEALVGEPPPLIPDASGQIDFHGWSSVVHAQAGMELAYLTPATPGRPGCTVTGRMVPAVAGRPLEASSLAGEGVTTVDAGDCLVLVAEHDGVVTRKGLAFAVEPALVIEGDVDLGVGSINTEMPIIIRGDIKQGFDVKSGADIEVQGVIEDARVSAKGNLEVRGGILPGHFRVKAHGNISCAYASGRELKCAELLVRGALRDCTVQSTAGVTATQITGSQVIAAGTIRCEVLGAPLATGTLVHVGIDPLVRARLDALAVELTDLARAHSTLAPEVARARAVLARLVAGRDPAVGEAAAKAKTLVEEEAVLKKTMQENQATQAELRQSLYALPGDAVVEVTRAVRAPVEVRIGDTVDQLVERSGPGMVFRIEHPAA